MKYSLHSAPEAKGGVQSDVWAVELTIFEVMTLEILNAAPKQSVLKHEKKFVGICRGGHASTVFARI